MPNTCWKKYTRLTCGEKTGKDEVRTLLQKKFNEWYGDLWFDVVRALWSVTDNISAKQKPSGL